MCELAHDTKMELCVAKVAAGTYTDVTNVYQRGYDVLMGL